MRLSVRRTIPCLTLLGLCGLLFSGCEALSPTQLWKLNRHPRENYGGDAYFSIPSEELPAYTVPRPQSQTAEVPQSPAF